MPNALPAPLLAGAPLATAAAPPAAAAPGQTVRAAVPGPSVEPLYDSELDDRAIHFSSPLHVIDLALSGATS